MDTSTCSQLPTSLPPTYRSSLYIKRISKSWSQGFSSSRHTSSSSLSKSKISSVQDSKVRKISFYVLYYGLITIFVYLILVGLPLWNGAVFYLWVYFFRVKSLDQAWVIFVAHSTLMTYMPLIFGRFEKPAEANAEASKTQLDARRRTALIIPCYKSAKTIERTLDAALQIFPPENIFVVDNCNAEKPPDNTKDLCLSRGVMYAFIGIGSKIIAEYVATINLAFDYCLMIDDDVALPPNLRLPLEKFQTQSKYKTACIGYTICARGANGSRGTPPVELQDFEYRTSGLSRSFSARWGSAQFAHGAIMLWDRKVLLKLFDKHPAFFCSEDSNWGIIARQAGYRIDFESTTFVKTEPPPYAFSNLERFLWPVEKYNQADTLVAGNWQKQKQNQVSIPALLMEDSRLEKVESEPPKFDAKKDEISMSPDSSQDGASEKSIQSASRGGYGEMTVLKQRLSRWMLFQLYDILRLLVTIAFFWNLGWRTLIADWALWISAYNNILMFIAPFVLPLLLWANYALTLRYLAVMVGINTLGVFAVNFFHLRKRPEGHVRWRVLIFFPPYRLALLWIGTFGLYRSLWKYGLFFAKKQPKVPYNGKLAALLPSLIIYSGNGDECLSRVPDSLKQSKLQA